MLKCCRRRVSFNVLSLEVNLMFLLLLSIWSVVFLSFWFSTFKWMKAEWCTWFKILNIAAILISSSWSIDSSSCFLSSSDHYVLAHETISSCDSLVCSKHPHCDERSVVSVACDGSAGVVWEEGWPSREGDKVMAVYAYCFFRKLWIIVYCFDKLVYITRCRISGRPALEMEVVAKIYICCFRPAYVEYDIWNIIPHKKQTGMETQKWWCICNYQSCEINGVWTMHWNDFGHIHVR